MKQRDVLRLALEADIALPTARRALREGPQVIRGRPGERAAEAMRRLGFVEGQTPAADKAEKEPSAA